MNRGVAVQIGLTNAFVLRPLREYQLLAWRAFAGSSRDKNAAQHCGLHNSHYSLHIPPKPNCRTTEV